MRINFLSKMWVFRVAFGWGRVKEKTVPKPLIENLQILETKEMAKDNRMILSGIRHRDANGNVVVFVSGMEDELSEAFAQKDIDRFISQGAISEDFKSTMRASEAAKPEIAKTGGK